MREDLGQVASLTVVRVIVQQHHRHPGRLKGAQQVGEQQRIALVQVDVPVAVANVELDRHAQVGRAPDEEAVQHLIGQPGRRPVATGFAGGTAFAGRIVRPAQPARDRHDDLAVAGPPAVKRQPDPVGRDRLEADHPRPERRHAHPLAQRAAVSVGERGSPDP